MWATSMLPPFSFAQERNTTMAEEKNETPAPEKVDGAELRQMLELPESAADADVISKLVQLIAALQQKYEALLSDAVEKEESYANRELDHFQDVITPESKAFWKEALLRNRDAAVTILAGLRDVLLAAVVFRGRRRQRDPPGRRRRVALLLDQQQRNRPAGMGRAALHRFGCQFHSVPVRRPAAQPQPVGRVDQLPDRVPAGLAAFLVGRSALCLVDGGRVLRPVDFRHDHGQRVHRHARLLGRRVHQRAWRGHRPSITITNPGPFSSFVYGGISNRPATGRWGLLWRYRWGP